MYEEDAAGINSEMRYITLELMKLAAKRNKPFEQVAAEFITNVYAVRRLIKRRVQARGRKPSSARE
ncbi:MAG: hypothetical protein QXH27_01220 [Candidatus Micrarchaeia archaeon]